MAMRERYIMWCHTIVTVSVVVSVIVIIYTVIILHGVVLVGFVEFLRMNKNKQLIDDIYKRKYKNGN